jgi:hypothetical protein
VKDEVRANLLARLAKGGPIFAGVVGYDETVVPQIVNALLSRHNFILLGLRGQAKSRILRSLATLLDEAIPSSRERDQRRSVRADLEVREDARSPRDGRRHADRVARSRPATSRSSRRRTSRSPM